MSLHHQPCLICQKLIIAEIPDNLDKDFRPMFERLVLTLICNRCGDLRDRRDRCLGFITTKCLLLYRTKVPNEEQCHIRNGMNIVLRKLAQVIAEYHLRPNTVHSRIIEKFVDQFMLRPGHYSASTREFRKACREAITGSQPEKTSTAPAY